MKQLSIRLFGSLDTPRRLTFRLVQASSDGAMIFSTVPQRMLGKWRLLWNYCPECNSCAPKIHHCDVCNADTKSHFYWNEEVKQSWWKKYTDKHRMVV